MNVWDSAMPSASHSLAIVILAAWLRLSLYLAVWLRVSLLPKSQGQKRKKKWKKSLSRKVNKTLTKSVAKKMSKTKDSKPKRTLKGRNASKTAKRTAKATISFKEGVWLVVTASQRPSTSTNAVISAGNEWPLNYNLIYSCWIAHWLTRTQRN